MSFFAVERIDLPVAQWSFNGISNYTGLFSKALFNRAVSNYLTIWIVGGAAVMIMAMLYAVILTSGVRLKRFWRAIIYLPNVISAVALGTIWLQYVFTDNTGLFDKVAGLLGAETPILWTGPEMVIWSLVIAYSFGMVGYIMLTFISGIEKISNEYYEAASLEGANIFQKFFFITLPLIKGVLRSNIVLWTVHLGTGVFAWVFMFSPNNIALGTVMPPNYMYELVFGARSSAITQRDAGAGAAVGMFIALVVVSVSLITTLITRSDDIEM